ncbi:MAG: S46 family peptidase [Bacteroidales bacterium]
MKKLLVILLLITSFASRGVAIEGMWLPVLIGKNIEQMQAMGLNLDAIDLYNEEGASLKDAIVRFGGGCTGAFISADGLLVTNHHCGYGQIQRHSSVENDYLKHGFWAGSREEELANPGLTITMLVRMEDVTQQVNAALKDGMDEEARKKAVREVTRQISDVASEDGRYKTQISPFYYGNEYYLFVFEVYRDVRLVGAPPSAIGKFGGDVDNWMWPRHSGDFSLFRVYANADNEPADYSQDNVPYTPSHFLPVSNKGVDQHDFTMIYGFPGRTSQYLTSHEVDYIIEMQNPAAIDIRTNILALYEQDMNQSDKVRIQYASKHARVSNAWKKWKGESRGLKNMNAVQRKQQMEQAFQLWAASQGHQSYQGLIDQFEKVYEDYLPYRFATTLYNEAGRGIEVVRYAQSFKSLVDASKDPETTDEALEKELEKLKNAAQAYFKDYHAPIDQKVLEVLVKQYIDLSDPAFMPEALMQVASRFGDNTAGFAENIFRRSMLVSEEKTMDFLNNYKTRNYKKLEKDPAYNFAIQLLDYYQQELRPHIQANSSALDSLYRQYTAGLRLAEPNTNFFPDANGTLRISYGRVEGSNPRDAVIYDNHSTGEGILEKAANKDIADYHIPERLEQLLTTRQYGDFDKNGELMVNFIASNHTTGGNSGSPVIGANGELIGLNFDRSWESTMSDIMFDPEQCRNIAINSQYILWVISQYAQMSYLLDEMVIVEEELTLDIHPGQPAEDL